MLQKCGVLSWCRCNSYYKVQDIFGIYTMVLPSSLRQSITVTNSGIKYISLCIYSWSFLYHIMFLMMAQGIATRC